MAKKWSNLVNNQGKWCQNNCDSDALLLRLRREETIGLNLGYIKGNDHLKYLANDQLLNVIYMLTRDNSLIDDKEKEALINILLEKINK